MESTTNDKFSTNQALNLCSSHLSGSWSSITQNDIECEELSGGMVNQLFVVLNKKSKEKVLIRLYGGRSVPNIDRLKRVGLEGEVLMMQLLSKQGIGPKILGIFTGGRIEEFMDGWSVLTDEDVVSQEVMGLFARKLAEMHSMQVPVNKTPRDYIAIIKGNLEKYWNPYKEFISTKPIPEDTPEKGRLLANVALNCDIYKLLTFYEKHLQLIPSKVVFSHGDLNRTNCLVNRNRNDGKDNSNKLLFIDFELCGYDYRGCDIGLHFRHRRFDPIKLQAESKNASYSYSLPSYKEFPTEHQKKLFIREYLHQIYLGALPGIDSNTFPSIDNEDHLLLEAEFYGGLYLFYRFSYIISNQRNNDFFHPAISGGSFIQELQDRMEFASALMNKKSTF